MEFVLSQDAYAFEPSEEYKIMMDQMIDNRNTGKRIIHRGTGLKI